MSSICGRTFLWQDVIHVLLEHIIMYHCLIRRELLCQTFLCISFQTAYCNRMFWKVSEDSTAAFFFLMGDNIATALIVV